MWVDGELGYIYEKDSRYRPAHGQSTFNLFEFQITEGRLHSFLVFFDAGLLSGDIAGELGDGSASALSCEINSEQ